MTDEPPDITQTGLKSRLARRLGMQVLFVWDGAGGPDEVAAEHVTCDAVFEIDSNDRAAMADAQDAGRRALAGARGAWEQREAIDQALERIAPQWPPRRMPGVDRAILRLATWELQNTPTPPKVVIDEAIELAKQFSTADSGRFVNGVLDKVLNERKDLLGGDMSSGDNQPPATSN